MREHCQERLCGCSAALSLLLALGGTPACWWGQISLCSFYLHFGRGVVVFICLHLFSSSASLISSEHCIPALLLGICFPCKEIKWTAALCSWSSRWKTFCCRSSSAVSWSMNLSFSSDVVRCTPVALSSHSWLLMLPAELKGRSSTAGKSDVMELVFHIQEQQSYLHVKRLLQWMGFSCQLEWDFILTFSPRSCTSQCAIEVALLCEMYWHWYYWKPILPDSVIVNLDEWF